jgi:hypothetical protein
MSSGDGGIPPQGGEDLANGQNQRAGFGGPGDDVLEELGTAAVGRRIGSDVMGGKDQPPPPPQVLVQDLAEQAGLGPVLSVDEAGLQEVQVECPRIACLPAAPAASRPLS